MRKIVWLELPLVTSMKKEKNMRDATARSGL